MKRQPTLQASLKNNATQTFRDQVNCAELYFAMFITENILLIEFNYLLSFLFYINTGLEVYNRNFNKIKQKHANSSTIEQNIKQRVCWRLVGL